MRYENLSDWTLSENKPKTNPISNPTPAFLLITQEIALLCEILLGAFTLNVGMVKLLK